MTILPEWQDPGDEEFRWAAVEDEDGGRVAISPVDTGLPITPVCVVEVAMLRPAEAANA